MFLSSVVNAGGSFNDELDDRIKIKYFSDWLHFLAIFTIHLNKLNNFAHYSIIGYVWVITSLIYTENGNTSVNNEKFVEKVLDYWSYDRFFVVDLA